VRFQIAIILIVASALAVGLAQEPARIASALDRSSLPAVEPPKRAVIGVALEGGGALGLAHIGVLQWFEEHRIPVDRNVFI
jgi:NTE family protein